MPTIKSFIFKSRLNACKNITFHVQDACFKEKIKVKNIKNNQIVHNSIEYI